MAEFWHSNVSEPTTKLQWQILKTNNNSTCLTNLFLQLNDVILYKILRICWAILIYPWVCLHVCEFIHLFMFYHEIITKYRGGNLFCYKCINHSNMQNFKGYRDLSKETDRKIISFIADQNKTTQLQVL